MFNVGAGEMVIILVVALLVLGPTRLPELARSLGKFVRQFRRQTEEVRSMVEREFYKMDEDLRQMEHPTLPPPADPHEGLTDPNLSITQHLDENEPPPLGDSEEVVMSNTTATSDPDDAGEPTVVMGLPTNTTNLKKQAERSKSEDPPATSAANEDELGRDS